MKTEKSLLTRFTSHTVSKRSLRRLKLPLVLLGVFMVAALPAAAVTVDLALPSYQPQPVSPPKDAGYVLHDGSVQIAAVDAMQGPVRALNDLFIKSHPGIKFTVIKGDSYGCFYSLIFDASVLSGVTGAAVPASAYSEYVHAPPFGVRVAHASLNPSAKTSPLAVIVNKSNPLNSLTTDQIAHIFAQGGRKPAISHWNQVGLKGEWASRGIHPCGLPWNEHYDSEDDLFPDLFSRFMGGGPQVGNYEMVQNYADVVKIVSQDPTAIGLTGLNRVTPDVKALAITGMAWGSTPSQGTAEEIVAGTYPYDRYLYLFARRTSKPFDPFVKEYLRMVLSREGQEAIASQSDGYLPLNANDVHDGLAQLR